MSVHAAPVTSSTVVVAVDVGETSVALSVTDADRRQVFGPVEFAMTRSASPRCSLKSVACCPARACAGQGQGGGLRSLSRAVAGAVGVAVRMGGTGAEPGPCR